MRVGFIGTGIMGSAIIEGLIRNECVRPEEIIGADVFAPGRERVREAYGIEVTDSNVEAVQKSDVIILSTKPYFYEGIIEEIRDVVTESQLVITLAAGVGLRWMDEKFAKPVKIIRTMPNVAARVGEAMTLACANDEITEEDKAAAMKILSSFGRAEFIPESLINAVTPVTSASPAYIFMVIEALADAAVEGGLPRTQAYPFVAQAVYGAAKLVLETGKHPGELKDMVCSPGGITIEGVRVLEEKGIRGAFIDAIKTSIDIQKK